MLKINPKFMYDEKRRKVGVLLTKKDFSSFLDELEDCDDVEYIKNSRKKKENLYSLDEIVSEIKKKK